MTTDRSIDPFKWIKSNRNGNYMSKKKKVFFLLCISPKATNKVKKKKKELKLLTNKYNRIITIIIWFKKSIKIRKRGQRTDGRNRKQMIRLQV